MNRGYSNLCKFTAETKIYDVKTLFMTFGTRGREYKSKILFPVNLELICRLGGKIEVNEKKLM